MARICHKHVCRHKEMFQDARKLYIVMEYCEKGDLAEYLKTTRVELAPAKVWRIFIQMC